MYGMECWVVKNQQENKISVAEMMMLRWIYGKIRWDRIGNDTIRERGDDITSIVENM